MIQIISKSENKNIILFIEGYNNYWNTSVDNGKTTKPGNIINHLQDDQFVRESYDLAIFKSSSYLTDDNWYISLIGRKKKIKIVESIRQSVAYLEYQLKKYLKHYEGIVLIAHSLGGLIAKQFMLDSKERRIISYISIAVPYFESNFEELEVKNDSSVFKYFKNLNTAWMNGKSLPPTTYLQGLYDRIVPPSASSNFDSREQKIIYSDDDHFSIINPKSKDDIVIKSIINQLIEAAYRIKSRNYRLSKITLKNIRCFSSLEVNFQDDCNWLMILGDNAAGKSTLLKSVGLGLCNETETISLMALDEGKFISKEKDEAFIKIELIEMGNSSVSTIETHLKYDKSSDEEIVRKEYDSTIGLSHVFICGYGTNRSLQANESHEDYNKLAALKSLFSTDSKLQNPELILLRNDKATREKIENKLLDLLMLDKDNYSLKYSKHGLELRGPWGSESIRSLSDGYRTTIQWILDFLSWAVYSKKFFEDSDFMGILIIDELELQLHPQWQREIVQRIRKQFPRIQVISTTHTPLIASGIADIDKAKLMRFKLTNEGEIETFEIDNKSLHGLTANQVLNTIAFEVHSTKNIKSQDELEEYVKLKQKKDLNDKDKVRYNELKEKLKDQASIKESKIARDIEDEIMSTLEKKLIDVDPEQLDLEVKNQLNDLFKKKK